MHLIDLVACASVSLASRLGLNAFCKFAILVLSLSITYMRQHLKVTIIILMVFLEVTDKGYLFKRKC